MKAARLLLIAACMAGSYASAQDLIVKKDGTVIQAKVTKVGTAEVEYKKWSNQDGPQYSIAIVDILAINYKNGEKETFENVGTSGGNKPSQSVSEGQTSVLPIKPEDLSPEAKAANDALLARYNAPAEFVVTKDKYKEDWGKRKADAAIACLGISSNSVLSNEDVEVSIAMGFLNKASKKAPAEWSLQDLYQWHSNPAIRFSIRNKTRQTVYVDLANTFYVTIGQSFPYYIPSSTTTSNSSSGGASVNLGSVASVLGIGGAAGTLANGVNVGGGSSSTTTSTTYAQRVIAIAPSASVDLSPKYFFGNEAKTLTKGLIYASSSYKYILRPWIVFNPKSEEGGIFFGDQYTYNAESSPIQMSFYVAYDTKESCTNLKVLPTNIYMKDLFGNFEGKTMNSRGRLSNDNVLSVQMHVLHIDAEAFPKH